MSTAAAQIPGLHPLFLFQKQEAGDKLGKDLRQSRHHIVIDRRQIPLLRFFIKGKTRRRLLKFCLQLSGKLLIEANPTVSLRPSQEILQIRLLRAEELTQLRRGLFYRGVSPHFGVEIQRLLIIRIKMQRLLHIRFRHGFPSLLPVNFRQFFICPRGHARKAGSLAGGVFRLSIQR